MDWISMDILSIASVAFLLILVVSVLAYQIMMVHTTTLTGLEPEQQSTSVREKSEATVKSDDDINVNVMSPQCDVELKEQLGRPRTMSQGAEDVNDAFVVKQRIRGTLSVGTLPRYQGTIDARQDSASSDLESRKDRSTAYGSYLQLQELIKEHDKQHEKVVSDKYNDEILKDFMLRKKRTKARMSLTEFLTDPRNFQGDEDQSLAGKHGRSISGKTDSEKKSSSSMFNFFRKPSQRPRNKEKHKDKSKSTHHFVAVSVSNSAKCDYCDKPLVNKDAVKCQVCSINTHDTCKESIGPCSKVSKHPKDKPPAGSLRDKKFSVSTSELSKAISFTVKDKPRPLSFYYGQNSKSLPGYTVPKQPPITSTIGQPINEEMEDPSSQTNISETLSGSMESLDEDATDDAHYENDPDLVLKDEPESWSVMVDKKKKKGLSKLDIKRQDVIYEMIQTEKHHVRTLKIMQKIFCHGMRNELNMDPNIIDKMFPMLSEIIEINTSFLNALKFRQGRSVVVDKIGDVLVEQFSGENGERMKYAYGIFCAHQAEAVAIYKEYKSDKKFLAFIKKCSQNTLCRRWSIQECILAVTHRITKYPLLIEAIIKATKANKADYPLLQEANTLVK
uniref:Rho guanine nucleotide exchange factor 28-like n=1 Tax=Saccoglossus kowalevskii TaxID=10224 RepID=A0ABM0ML21_SACKO